MMICHITSVGSFLFVIPQWGPRPALLDGAGMGLPTSFAGWAEMDLLFEKCGETQYSIDLYRTSSTFNF